MAALEPLVTDGFVPYPEDIAARYRAEGWWTDETMPEPLFATVARVPGKIAIISGDTVLTYAELGDRILQLAAGLRHLGVSRGDRVVVHLPNIPEFIAFVYAFWQIGAIPVFAPVAHRRTEIEHFVQVTEARVYVTVAKHDGADLATLAAELKAAWPSLEHTVVLDEAGGGADLDRLLEHDPLPHERRTLPADVALLQMSGGTTGRPKLIPHTSETYLHSVRQSIPICGITENSVQLTAVPICHSMSVRSPGFLGVLSVGGTVVLAPNGSPDVVFPLIERHGITQSSIVPPLLLAWLNSSLKQQYDLSSLESLHVGGARLSVEAARRVKPELDVILQQGFGMAEGLVNYNRFDVDEETSLRCQGRPISPGDELLLLDDAGDPVPPGAPGHLLTRGPTTIRGYYRDPEENARSFTADGFYRTGDIIERYENGYLAVVGRSKDQINRGGEKVAPEEVENLILAHGSVHDVSVIGIPDQILGERVKAFVVLRAGADPATLKLSSIRAFLRERGLASYKLPDALEVVAEFPQTAVGKVSKRRQRSQ
ncbi:(2,3-dihydroxybenzoyl)adenylate synthase [Micromonospora craniellae]|uniref:(2,3-dihydroxybenzoyl)adenylate synthase n=1 Tax=Micromonospora craniellae TaxID=2294034 RepID=A0A372FSN0_9ACTN|nr:AMP-binding protein [Micromonospora craniellae]QOC94749.1 AMP-binding protein [Micromonospora craniellae]RFS43718.1 (2,3-dihydroxybenzoyl)adenylate synthase [Micromonospora craniellae]